MTSRAVAKIGTSGFPLRSFNKKDVAFRWSVSPFVRSNFAMSSHSAASWTMAATSRSYTSTPRWEKIHTINVDGNDVDLDDEEALEALFQEREKEAERRYEEERLPFEISYKEDAFENEDEDVSNKWTPGRDARCGALAIKVGCMPAWDKWGQRHACTVLSLDGVGEGERRGYGDDQGNVVLEVKTVETHGYNSVVVGAGGRRSSRVTKPLKGHFRRCLSSTALAGREDILPVIVREFRLKGIGADRPPIPGTRIGAAHFVPGQNVDVSGTTKGKGFQGAMKRHNFKGLPASHGVSKSHRALGSTGNCQDPGRVFKGKKMAGRMGGTQTTVQNLRILKIDRGRNLLYVLGAVPGNKGEFVEINDAVKKPLWGTKHVWGNLSRPPLEGQTYDGENAVDDGSGRSVEVWMPMPDIDPFLPYEIETIG